MGSKEGFLQDFAREMEDDESDIKDVRLMGSDGGYVHATKAILAIRNPFFRRMFYGNFKESSQDCDFVELNYCTPVLRFVVAYCYTNEACFDKLFHDKQLNDDSSVVPLVQALDATNYLELPELRKCVLDKVEKCSPWKERPLAIMEELMIRGLIDEELWTSCLGELRANTDTWWSGKDATNTSIGIRDISLALLEELFDSLKEDLPAVYAVDGLKEWNETSESITEEEQLRLQKLASDIDLKSMGIQKLAHVQPCDLFSQDQLYNALVTLGRNVVEATPQELAGRARKQQMRESVPIRQQQGTTRLSYNSDCWGNPTTMHLPMNF